MSSDNTSRPYNRYRFMPTPSWRNPQNRSFPSSLRKTSPPLSKERQLHSIRQKHRRELLERKQLARKEKTENFTPSPSTDIYPSLPWHELALLDEEDSQAEDIFDLPRSPASARSSVSKRNKLDRWIDKQFTWRFILLLWLFLFIDNCLIMPLPYPLSNLIQGLLTNVSFRITFAAWLIICLFFSLFFLLLIHLTAKLGTQFKFNNLLSLFVGSILGLANLFIVISIHDFLFIHLIIFIGSILEVNVNSAINLIFKTVVNSSTISFIILCTTLIVNFVAIFEWTRKILQRWLKKSQN